MEVELRIQEIERVLNTIQLQGEEILARVGEIEEAIELILDTLSTNNDNTIELTEAVQCLNRLVSQIQIVIHQQRKFGIGEYYYPKK